MRKERKIQHIESYFKTEYRGDTLLSDVYVDHNALPELALEEIDTSLTFLGKTIAFPLMINAMTGGSDISASINEDLAKLCDEFFIPMAVGSQKIALEDEEAEESFKIVRSILRDDHCVIGNLGAFEKLEDYEAARKMIDADAMQIHLNPLQELVMEEGDRDFRGALANIADVARNLSVPLIVKEVGFGLSVDAARRLIDAGVKILDVSGTGGSNFIEIEDLRCCTMDFSDMYQWGIPTAKSILDCRSVSDEVFIVAAGGIRSAWDIVNSIVLGADMAAISGEILTYLLHGGYSYACSYVESLIYKTKILMTLLGVKTIGELKKVPYRLTGRLLELTK